MVILKYECYKNEGEKKTMDYATSSKCISCGLLQVKNPKSIADDLNG